MVGDHDQQCEQMSDVDEADQQGWEHSRAGWVSDALVDERSELQREVDALREQRAQLAAEVESARAVGREEGRRSGIAELRKMVARIEADSDTRRSELVNGSVDAAIAAAATLLRRTIGTDRELVADLVRQAMQMRPEHTPIRIRVCGDDLDSAAACLDAADLSTLYPEADPTLSAGDVILEYNDGRVDCRIDTLLAGFSEDLRRELDDE